MEFVIFFSIDGGIDSVQDEVGFFVGQARSEIVSGAGGLVLSPDLVVVDCGVTVAVADFVLSHDESAVDCAADSIEHFVCDSFHFCFLLFFVGIPYCMPYFSGLRRAPAF